MATYTSRNRLIKQATNENKNTWGVALNDGMIDLVDFATHGWTNLDLSAGNATLTTANGAADQARAALLNITATGGVARTVEIPAVEHLYRVRNNGTSTVLIKTAAGTGVVVLRGQRADVWCDGTECYRSAVDGWGLLSSAALTGTSAALSFAVTGQKFAEALVRIKTASTGTGANFTFGVNGAGGSGSGPTIAVSSGVKSGAVYIPDYTGDVGLLNFWAGVTASDATTASGGVVAGWRMAGGLTSGTLSSDQSITGGTVEVLLK